MSMSHLNHVRFLLQDSTDASGAVNLYTPPTNKVLEVKHMIISWTGDANAAMQIYDDTNGTSDPVFDFNFDYGTAESQATTIYLGPLDGFYFGKAFRVIATASKVNLMVSGILW